MSTSPAQPPLSTWFVVVTALFVTSLVTANIIAVKLVGLGSLVFPAAVVIFPLSYIFGDVLTEVYGFRRARQVIWLGFACNLLAVIAIYLGGLLPPAAFWTGQEAYQQILGFTPRLLVASFTAYIIGQFVNAIVLARMKIVTRGRWLWTRTIASTLVGEGLDSLVFISLAFIGTIPSSAMLAAILTQWLLKSAYEIIITPFTYLAVNFLKRKEGLDIFDHDTRFNPLRLSGE
jgi:queuosine precursor transporter